MKLLREPLLHFAAIGALLFAGHAWLNRNQLANDATDRTIRITERELTWLSDTTTKTWQRAPRDSELPGLLAEYLREELLAREARALELDRDDTVVRRRLAQKMDFIVEGTAQLAAPTEAQLRARFDADPAKFQSPAMLDFRQVLFSTEKRGELAAADARKALAALARDGAQVDAGALGDASLLPESLDGVDEQAIAARFGADFAREVAALKPGEWHGPFESDYGLHLVLVTRREPGRPLAFEDVRAQLADAWRREQDAAARTRYFAGLLARYDIEASAGAQHVLDPALAQLKGATP